MSLLDLGELPKKCQKCVCIYIYFFTNYITARAFFETSKATSIGRCRIKGRMRQMEMSGSKTGNLREGETEWPTSEDRLATWRAPIGRSMHYVDVASYSLGTRRDPLT